jgi:heme/copper-type cytochrome/quinol oxidase subunit 4
MFFFVVRLMLYISAPLCLFPWVALDVACCFVLFSFYGRSCCVRSRLEYFLKMNETEAHAIALSFVSEVSASFIDMCVVVYYMFAMRPLSDLL